KAMALFAAEAVVDRNVNANLGRGWLTVSEAERPVVERALLVLEASWVSMAPGFSSELAPENSPVWRAGDQP
ncbi:MAG: hypothetical protein WBA40_03345, partial [Roseiarcus sp.]